MPVEVDRLTVALWVGSLALRKGETLKLDAGLAEMIRRSVVQRRPVARA